MIDRDHGLSVVRQAKALGISRGSVYYRARPASDADLTVMRRMDELHLEYPFAGSRMLKGLLNAEGWDDVASAAAVTCRNAHADEADGHRGAVPAPEHVEARAGAQDLSLPAAQAGDHAARSGLGDGHYLRPDSPRLRLSRRGNRLVQPTGPGLGECRSR